MTRRLGHVALVFVALVIVVGFLNAFAPRLVIGYIRLVHLRGLGHVGNFKAFVVGFFHGLLFLVDLAVSIWRHHAHVFLSDAPNIYALGLLFGFVALAALLFGDRWYLRR